MTENNEQVITDQITDEQSDEIYDEDYDESYDDQILDEIMEEESENDESEVTDENSFNDEILDETRRNYQKVDEKETVYIKVFKRYFEKLCEKDEFFKMKYKEEYLVNCFSYCKNNVQKLAKNGVAMIQSGKVFEMATEYFNDEIYVKEEQEKIERQKKAEERAKEQEKKKQEEELKKQKEEQEKKHEEEYQKWKEGRETTLSESEIEIEKYKHLKQQDLFDF